MPKPNLSAHGTQVVKPDDFDQFWQEIMKEVDSIPLNASIELDSLRSSEEVEVFEVKYDSLDGLRIAGWYCLPREREIPLPARVFYPGYISEPTLTKSHTSHSQYSLLFIYMQINIKILFSIV